MARHSVTIRPATSADLAAITAIQGNFGWPADSYLNYDCRVAICGEQLVGFLVSRETAPGEREILNLAVASGMRRQGIGKSLMEDEISRFHGRWFLEVRESNDAAIKLYGSIGFRATGTRPDYYPDSREAAIVMTFFS